MKVCEAGMANCVHLVLSFSSCSDSSRNNPPDTTTFLARHMALRQAVTFKPVADVGRLQISGCSSGSMNLGGQNGMHNTSFNFTCPLNRFIDFEKVVTTSHNVKPGCSKNSDRDDTERKALQDLTSSETRVKHNVLKGQNLLRHQHLWCLSRSTIWTPKNHKHLGLPQANRCHGSHPGLKGTVIADPKRNRTAALFNAIVSSWHPTSCNPMSEHKVTWWLQHWHSIWISHGISTKPRTCKMFDLTPCGWQLANDILNFKPTFQELNIAAKSLVTICQEDLSRRRITSNPNINPQGVLVKLSEQHMS